MKKIINLVTGIGIIVIVVLFVYNVFIDCDSYDSEFGKRFTLKEMDYVKVDEEVYIKLLDIKDTNTINEDGSKSGEYSFKIIVLNDRKVAYVKMGSFSNSKEHIEKLGYYLEYVEMKDTEHATFIITKEKE